MLPMLRSTVCRLRSDRRPGRPRLRSEDAPPERELEAKLSGGPVPGRDRDSPQMERIGSGGVDPAEARAATAEPGRLHEVAIRLGEVVPSAIRIGEELDRRTELSLEIQPRAQDLLPRLAVPGLAEVGVG